MRNCCDWNLLNMNVTSTPGMIASSKFSFACPPSRQVLEESLVILNRSLSFFYLPSLAHRRALPLANARLESSPISMVAVQSSSPIIAGPHTSALQRGVNNDSLLAPSQCTPVITNSCLSCEAHASQPSPGPCVLVATTSPSLKLVSEEKVQVGAA
eukprot:scaffold327780_cov61-Tisochrysis_lutea.AAC.4